MRKFYIFLIIVLITKITIGQSLSNDNNLLWDYLSNSLKNINISICDTLTEEQRENSFFGKYLTTEISSNKKSFYLKFDSIEYSLKYSTRDTIYASNNYDIFIINLDSFEIGIVLYYCTDENYTNFGAFLDDRILLFDKVSNERYIIAIKSLFETVLIPKKGLLIPPAPDDIEIVEFKINPKLNSSDIYSIVKVNDKLEPISRLDFCDGKLISFTEISMTNPNYETINIYTCNDTENFETINLFQLKRLLLWGTSGENNCSIRVKKIIDDTYKPYWMRLWKTYD